MSRAKKSRPPKTGAKATVSGKQEIKKAARPSTQKQSKRFLHEPLLPGSWKVNAGIFLLFVIATTVLYSGDLHLGFFRVDDPQYVVKNPWIKGINGENISYILSHPYFVNYSPLHLFSYMIDYAIAGLDAFAFHLSSNIWGGIVAGFVWLVALALTQNKMIAAAAALLFVVHPVHVEAIVWIASRKDLVAAAFILPSLLAYLKYRKDDDSKKWYVLSLSLFLFAIAGKLSAASFPAVLIAIDLFLEKRPFIKSLIDKIPFVVLSIIFAVAVAGAQPKTGVHPDVSVMAKAFAESMWLLTGFGTYVIYRIPPEQGNILFQIVGAMILVAPFLLPLLFWKRYPVVAVLIYWILFTYLPTQVLSFTYPVTDRYLFLPSVAAVILFAWLIFSVRLPQRIKLGLASVAVLLIGFLWTQKTLNYLNEWKDPRTVWQAAREKSKDVQVYYNLGWDYLDKAASLGENRRKPPLEGEEARKYASAVWKDDPRLPQLLAELSTSQHKGPVEKAFKEYLQNNAKENLDQAVAIKGNHVMADLFFHRGMLFIDKGDMPSAKKEFLAGVNEASRLNYSEGRQEVLVNCHYNLSIAEWTLGNYREALPWIKLAEEEQNKFGRVWFPELTENRKKLEAIIATLH